MKSLSADLNNFLKQKHPAYNPRTEGVDEDELSRSPERARGNPSHLDKFPAATEHSTFLLQSNLPDFSALGPDHTIQEKKLRTLVQQRGTAIGNIDSDAHSWHRSDSSISSSVRDAQSRQRRSNTPSPEPGLWFRAANMHHSLRRHAQVT
jgi:hypothetical protein